ncbi:Isochorismatase domain-containing protein 1 [Phlyctochytrium bullatum]|nr:Isochorismatase domain-containing protein 1 [Phlyctochytrium bullatum]
MSTAAVAARRGLKIPQQSTAFFVCDIQEKFRPHIWNYQHVVNTAAKMVKASKILNIPLVVTEQNPKALGGTVPELDISGAVINAPKTKFSMWVPEVEAKVRGLNTTDVVLFGIESHVCVLQTAMDLIEGGIHVWVLADGVSSMNKGEVKIAVERMRAAGATITTSDSILFQLLVDAKHENFKAVQGIVKDTKETTTSALETLIANLTAEQPNADLNGLTVGENYGAKKSRLAAAITLPSLFYMDDGPRRTPSPSKALSIDCLAPEIAQMILLCVNPRDLAQLIYASRSTPRLFSNNDIGVAERHLLRFYSDELTPPPRPWREEEDEEENEEEEEDDDESDKIATELFEVPFRRLPLAYALATVSIRARRHQRLKAFKLLLSDGLPGRLGAPDLVRKRSHSVLFYATHPDLIKCFARHGADVNARNPHRPEHHPTHLYSLMWGFVDDSRPRIPCLLKRTKLVETFVSLGADVNARNGNQLTPLIVLSLCKNREEAVPVAKILIEAGADADAVDAEGRSATEFLWSVGLLDYDALYSDDDAVRSDNDEPQ